MTADETNTPVLEDTAETMESALAELVELLRAQFQQLQEEKYDDFVETGQKAAPLLQHVTTSQAHLTHVAFERIRKVHAMHHQIGLALQSRSKEMGEALGKVRAGKSGLKAYKNAGV